MGYTAFGMLVAQALARCVARGMMKSVSRLFCDAGRPKAVKGMMYRKRYRACVESMCMEMEWECVGFFSVCICHRDRRDRL